MAGDSPGPSGDGGGSMFGGGNFGVGIGQIGSSIGGAVADLFAAKGYEYKKQGALIEQAQYTEAAGFARENEQYTDISTAIKEMQTARETSMVMGAQQAGVAGAGFEESGSARDLLADSARQGALAQQTLAFQGQITHAGYEEQAKALDSQAAAAGVAAQAASTAETGAKWGAAIKGVTAVAEIAGTAAMMSDRRMKEDIVPIGKLYDGQTVYRFRFKGERMVHIGLMAQEVEELYPQAVQQIQGIKFVDYGAATEAAAHT